MRLRLDADEDALTGPLAASAPGTPKRTEGGNGKRKAEAKGGEPKKLRMGGKGGEAASSAGSDDPETRSLKAKRRARQQERKKEHTAKKGKKKCRACGKMLDYSCFKYNESFCMEDQAILKTVRRLAKDQGAPSSSSPSSYETTVFRAMKNKTKRIS